jgi:predicted nucleic acid-binding protein
MPPTGADDVFVDTNVLIYHQLARSPWHSAARQKLQDLQKAGHPLWVSRQIFREYLAAMSGPGMVTQPVTMVTLISHVQSFQAQFLIAEDGPVVTRQLLVLLSSVICAGKQIHDANIVATMLAYNIPKLLTHNVADFTRFASWITVMPLV